MKFSWTVSWVKCLNGEKNNISGIWFSTLKARTEMVFETLVFSLFNHLTQLIAQENFIILL
jgi:hypothetical protein